MIEEEKSEATLDANNSKILESPPSGCDLSRPDSPDNYYYMKGSDPIPIR